MQILEPPQTTSYSSKEDGHIIETFLFSTKPNEADWQVSKAFGHKLADKSVGHDFIIIPELINKPLSQKGGGHYWDWTEDEYLDILKGYQNHSHGKIVKKKGPYYYGDGTDDYFYMANVKLNNSQAAAALMEHGARTWIPYAVSPHIYPIKQENGLVEDAEFIGLALVIKGAYGPDAVVTKYCHGEEFSCNKSLSASNVCDKEDKTLAAMISSYLQRDESKSIMEAQTTQVKDIPVNSTNNPQQTYTFQTPATTQAVEETKKEETNKVTVDTKELEDLKKKAEQVTSLINKDKTNTLTGIFKSVKDETIRKQLVDKYFEHNTDILNDFYKDISTHVFPSLIEEAKAQAEKELMNKTVEENKGKSKAGSTLTPEPEMPKSDNKDLVPNNVNEVLRLRKLMTGGF